MGLGELLTTEQKIALLEKMKETLSIRIYALYINMGIDPETIGNNTNVFSDSGIINGKGPAQLKELKKHSNNLMSVIKKLEELKNV